MISHLYIWNFAAWRTHTKTRLRSALVFLYYFMSLSSSQSLLTFLDRYIVRFSGGFDFLKQINLVVDEKLARKLSYGGAIGASVVIAVWLSNKLLGTDPIGRTRALFGVFASQEKKRNIQVKSSHFMSSWVDSSQLRSCWVMSGLVRSGRVRSGQVGSGKVR